MHVACESRALVLSTCRRGSTRVKSWFGIKNQVIVQRAHRYGYDHAMFLCGARVTEVVTMDDYKRACGAG